MVGPVYLADYILLGAIVEPGLLRLALGNDAQVLDHCLCRLDVSDFLVEEGVVEGVIGVIGGGVRVPVGARGVGGVPGGGGRLRGFLFFLRGAFSSCVMCLIFTYYHCRDTLRIDGGSHNTYCWQ